MYCVCVDVVDLTSIIATTTTGGNIGERAGENQTRCRYVDMRARARTHFVNFADRICFIYLFLFALTRSKKNADNNNDYTLLCVCVGVGVYIANDLRPVAKIVTH